jgi:hypothetical protein
LELGQELDLGRLRGCKYKIANAVRDIDTCKVVLSSGMDLDIIEKLAINFSVANDSLRDCFRILEGVEERCQQVEK